MMQRQRSGIALLGAIILVGVCALCGTACSPTPENDPEVEAMSYVQTIDAKDARALMQEENVVVLDVRSPEEYASGHIENAVLLPLGEITESTASEVIPDKSVQVIVYCRSGVRSAEASKKLIELGYENVYDLGGIQSWPYDVKKGESAGASDATNSDADLSGGPVPGACGTR